MKKMRNFMLCMLLSIGLLSFLMPSSVSAATAGDGTYIWPVTTSARITAGWTYPKGGYHGATDFGVPIGTPVYATASGTVTEAKDIGCTGSHVAGYPPLCTKSGCPGSYANRITISHGNNVYSSYCHLKTGGLVVKVGDTVSQGQLIGYSGNSGKTQGAHLHFGLKIGGNTVDPQNYLTKTNTPSTPKPSEHNPMGVIDNYGSEYNKVSFSGWCFDEDDLGAALEVHVWSGNIGIGVLKADQKRTDVGAAYPGAGDYHGFDGSLSTNLSGPHEFSLYAINVGGGGNTLLGTVTIDVKSDTTAPQISNAKITDIDATGYTVSCTVTDSGSGVNRVQFPSWTAANWQDDIQPNWEVNPQASGTANGNVYSYRVNTSDHNGETGEYTTHIYAFDNAGNVSNCQLDSLNVPGLPEEATDLPASFYARVQNVSTGTYLTVDLSSPYGDASRGKKMVFNKANADNSQLWHFIRFNGSYLVVPVANETMAIDLLYARDINGTEVGAYPLNYNPSQQWKVYKLSDGSYALKCNCSDTKVLTPASGSIQNGVAAQISAYNESARQKFRLIMETNPSSEKPVVEGKFEGRTYQVFDKPLTWEDAKAACEKLGGHLVTVTSGAEESFVESLIAKGTKYMYWMGGKLDTSKGAYKWVTGEAFSYTNWVPGQPDNNGGCESYLQIYTDKYSEIPSVKINRWNDAPNDNYLPGEGELFHMIHVGYICEFENTTPPTPQIESLSITSKPTKTVYMVGDTLNTTGLTLQADYSDGSSRKVTNGFTCTPLTLKNAGQQTITVSYEKKTVTFQVTVKAYSSLEDYKNSISLSQKNYVYDGNEKKPKVSIGNLVEGRDFAVSYKDNLNAGTAQVVVKGMGTFTGTITTTFSISRADLSDREVTLSQTVYTYDGNEKRPNVQVEGLQNGRDYQVTYSNNRDVGNARVNISGIGNYQGSIRMMFTIKAAESKPEIDKSSWLYDDVPETSGWRYDAIKYVKDHGIMNGISGTRNFAPDAPLTRAMFATIIYRMEGSPKASYSAKFPDVPNGNYFSVPIIWANKAGIINGHSNTGLFGTNENITREDMVVIMYRYCKYKGIATNGRAALSRFPDAGQVSGYAKEAVQWAVANGIINGRSNTGMLDPKGNASRVETAAIIQRFMTKIK